MPAAGPCPPKASRTRLLAYPSMALGREIQYPDNGTNGLRIEPDQLSRRGPHCPRPVDPASVLWSGRSAMTAPSPSRLTFSRAASRSWNIQFL